jgi:hypothetical protein
MDLPANALRQWPAAAPYTYAMNTFYRFGRQPGSAIFWTAQLGVEYYSKSNMLLL